MPVLPRGDGGRQGPDEAGHDEEEGEEVTVLAALRRVDWARLAEWLVLAGVLAIAALISYTHLRDVWRHAGAPWEDLGPLLPDGLFASAWLQMRRRRRQAVAVGWLAWLAGGVALLATLAGNIAAAVIDGHWTWLDIVVAAFPAAVLALAWELVTGHGRPASSPGGEDLEERPAQLEEPTRVPVLIPAADLAATIHAAPAVQLTALSSVPPADMEDMEADLEETVGDGSETWEDKRDRLLRGGAGRQRLARELDVSEWDARKLQEEWRRREETEQETSA